MSYWSRNAAQQFIAKRNAKQLQDAKLIHDQEMINMKSPEVWRQLVNEFERSCADFNKEPDVGGLLIFCTPDQNHLKITRSDRPDKSLEASIIPGMAVVTITGTGFQATPSLSLQCRVIEGTSEVGLFIRDSKESKGEFLATTDIVQSVLNEFLEIVLI